jgi:hypothetical protein
MKSPSMPGLLFVEAAIILGLFVMLRISQSERFIQLYSNLMKILQKMYPNLSCSVSDLTSCFLVT